MTPEALSTLIVSVAIVFQSLEHLQLREVTGAQGVWRWSVVRKDFAGWPGSARSALDLVLGEPGFTVLLVARGIAALGFAAAVLGGTSALVSWILGALIVSHIGVALRFRGCFNGASDSMTLVVLTGIGLGHLSQPWIGAWYVAVQVCASFAIAGVVKLRRANWRNGRALPAFLASSVYGTPGWARWVPAGVWCVAAWALIAFECLFPLALLDRRVCSAAITMAMLFHLVNFRIFGLNRFVWAWGAAYPLLYACSRGG